MAIPKPILLADLSLTTKAIKRKRKEKKARPIPLEKESELPHIPLEWSIEVLIKKGQPSEGPFFQGMSSTLTKVLGKETKLGKETPTLEVNKNLDI